jgi:hypothetical protein
VIAASFPNSGAYAIEYDDGEVENEVKQRCVLSMSDED